MGLARIAAALAAALVLVLAIGASLEAHAQVYRCTVDGKTVYSDKPCGAASKSVNVGGNTVAAPTATEQLQHEAVMGRIAVGMTAQQVERAWGKPRAINTDVRESGQREQWVYERDGGDAYVYLQNGRVTSFSTRTPGLARPTPRPPSTKEIEAAERAEKAVERKHVTQISRLSREAVRQRLGEPDKKDWALGFEFWTYLPTARDQQTRTVIQFNSYGQIFDVERKVEY